MYGLLVGGFVEDGGRAVDLVSGQEQGGDGAGRHALLLVEVQLQGRGVGGEGLVALLDGVPLQTELVKQVVEGGRGTGTGVDVDRGRKGPLVDLGVRAAFVGQVGHVSLVSPCQRRREPGGWGVIGGGVGAFCGVRAA